MFDPDIHEERVLEPPNLREGHELYSVVASALKSRGLADSERASVSHSFWPAEHFNLEKVAIFRDASEDERERILEACGRTLLEEAYCIEQCGMYFAAKMSLMADSAQERMLFSLFASDEAVHFNLISEYLSERATAEAREHPFIKLIEEILRNEDKFILTYMVQVILEGWGINHYHSLARDCNDAGLKEVFDGIIRDEARHHATGIILLKDRLPSPACAGLLAEMMSRLLFLVQVGPQSVVSQIEQVKGYLSKTQKTKVFEELQCKAETAKKLETLRALTHSVANAEAIYDKLDRQRAFDPFSASQCADIRG